jgi:hypothetical protein
VVNRPLDNAPGIAAPHFGGSGDGFTAAKLENLALDSPVLIIAAYRGGTGDGFASGSLANFPVDNPALFASSYAGGAGDGFSAARLTSFDLSTASFPVVQYLGGAGDGFAALALTNLALDGLPAPTVPYVGGSADGFDSELLANWPMQFRFGSPATFATYQSLVFTPSQIAAGSAAPLADADMDGIPNLLEFALGSDPVGGNASPILSGIAPPELFGAAADGESYLTLDFPFTTNALGVLLSAEFSSTLTPESWSSAGSVLLLSQSGRRVVRDNQPASTVTARFGRVRAELQP